jgi:glycosyltransferase involved in cell wall biosynthesis
LGRGFLGGMFVKMVGNGSDGVICVSRYLSIEAVDIGIHAGKINVIHNGIGDKGLPRESKERLRRELKLPAKSKIVTFVGSLSEAKGADIFAILACHMHDRMPDARFYLVGGGPEMDSLRRYCSRSGISDTVTFTGAVSHDESLQYMKASDVLVIPSRIEGFGLTALEGMRLGVPIAASKSGALSEILGKSSLTNNLPMTVRDILNKKSFRYAIIKENRKLSLKFSWEKMANETERIYRKITRSA